MEEREREQKVRWKGGRRRGLNTSPPIPTVGAQPRLSGSTAGCPAVVPLCAFCTQQLASPNGSFKTRAAGTTATEPAVVPPRHPAGGHSHVSNCRRPGAAVVGGTYGGSTAAARMLKMQKTKPGSRSEIGAQRYLAVPMAVVPPRQKQAETETAIS